MTKLLKTHEIKEDGVEYWLAELSNEPTFKFSVGVRDTDTNECALFVRKFKTFVAAEKYFNDTAEKA